MLNVLDDVCCKMGFVLRKQLPELPIWTERAETVVDLSAEERELLKHAGGGALEDFLRERGEFSIPALDLAAPRPLTRSLPLDRALIVIPERDRMQLEIAEALSRLVPGGMEIGSDAAAMECGTRPLLLLGTSNSNRLIRKLAARQLAFANGLVPGKGGWMVQTVAGGEAVIIAADNMSLPGLLEHLPKYLDGTTLLRADGVVPGPRCRKLLGRPDALLRSVALHISRLGEAAATFEGMEREIIRSFDSGGKAANRDNGHPTIPSMIRMHTAWRYTGERRFLKVFRNTLFGLINYFLATPGGASYPSDYDFYLGNLINCWSDAEGDEIFSDSDRLLVSGFLLGSARLIDKYHRIYWPVKPGLLRFNHETFPALSLEWAARYFETFVSAPEFNCWHRHARLTFSGPVETFGRQTENSSSYQWIVPSQKFAYDALYSPEAAAIRPGIAEVVSGIGIATDPLGLAVPYGDGEPVMATVAQFDLLRGIAALSPGGNALRLLLDRSFEGMGREPFLLLPQPGWGNFFFPEEASDAGFAAVGKWEVLPLADHVRLRNQPSMPGRFLADKLAVRSGRTPDSQYLLFEPFSCDAHAHFDMNSILAYTHCGRWGLVDNGYGKPHGVENMEEAFQRRETGPRCHNTVIFYNREGNPVIPPPFAAIVKQEEAGHFHFLETVLGNIEGVIWSRALLVMSERFLLVADRIRFVAGTGIGRVECLYNALGEVVKPGPESVLEQQGIRTFLTLSGDGGFRSSEYRTAGYEAVLGGPLYPWAIGPVRQFSRVAEVRGEGELHFAALCEMSFEKLPAYRLQKDTVHGSFGAAVEFAGQSFRIVIGEETLTVEFPGGTPLPSGLSPAAFGPCGPRPCERACGK